MVSRCTYREVYDMCRMGKVKRAGIGGTEACGKAELSQQPPWCCRVVDGIAYACRVCVCVYLSKYYVVCGSTCMCGRVHARVVIRARLNGHTIR